MATESSSCFGLDTKRTQLVIYESNRWLERLKITRGYARLQEGGISKIGIKYKGGEKTHFAHYVTVL